MSTIVLGEFKPTYNERQAEQRKYLDQLASGKRATASTDATSIAIGTRISADSTALATAATSASTGQALLSVADGGLSRTSEVLEQLKSLATLAQSGTLSATDLATTNAQFSALKNELDGIASTTSFNGQSLLDGSSAFATGVNVQLGANASDTVAVSFNTTTSAALGLTGTNLLTPAGASAALTAVDSAINTVAGDRAQVGATSEQFAFSADLIATSRENADAAASNLLDADFGASVTGAANASLLSQANIASLQRANAQKRNLLSLLQ
jgi:flagellin